MNNAKRDNRKEKTAMGRCGQQTMTAERTLDDEKLAFRTRNKCNSSTDGREKSRKTKEISGEKLRAAGILDIVPPPEKNRRRFRKK